MKRPVICFVMTCIFTFSAVQPFMVARAADLWNSQSDKQVKPGKTFYNKKKPSKNNDRVIFNRRVNNKSKVGRSSLVSRVRAGKKIMMTKQKYSKLWGIMSASAVSGRQADIDRALQQEYKMRKSMATMMVRNRSESKKRRAILKEKNHQRFEELKAQREEDRHKRLEKKRAALERMKKNKGKGYSQAAGSSKKKSSVFVGKKKSSSKKPTKLFNGFD